MQQTTSRRESTARRAALCRRRRGLRPVPGACRRQGAARRPAPSLKRPRRRCRPRPVPSRWHACAPPRDGGGACAAAGLPPRGAVPPSRLAARPRPLGRVLTGQLASGRLRPDTPVPPASGIRRRVNDCPLAGRKGGTLSSRASREPLRRKAEGNVAIRLAETDQAGGSRRPAAARFSPASSSRRRSSGRCGATMRREGFELAVGCPQVILAAAADGRRLEPSGTVAVDVDEAFAGAVADALAACKAALLAPQPSGAARSGVLSKAWCAGSSATMASAAPQRAGRGHDPETRALRPVEGPARAGRTAPSPRRRPVRRSARRRPASGSAARGWSNPASRSMRAR